MYIKCHRLGNLEVPLQVSIPCVIPRTRDCGQIATNSLPHHAKEMLADQTYLRVVPRRIERISILKGEAIAMVNEYIAVGHIMHEERPEYVANHNWIGRVLTAFDDVVK